MKLCSAGQDFGPIKVVCLQLLYIITKGTKSLSYMLCNWRLAQALTSLVDKRRFAVYGKKMYSCNILKRGRIVRLEQKNYFLSLQRQVK